jgi:hypothetical protein
MNKRISTLICVIVLFVSAIGYTQMIAEITEDIETNFGTYHPYLVDITPQASPYTVAPDFSNVVNFDQFEFSEADLNILRENGFVVKPSSFCQIHHNYNYCYDNEIPVFITTDAVLHTYHILYDYILRMLEVRQFADDLNHLNKTMVLVAQTKYEEAQDPDVKETARKILAYFAVADTLLDNTSDVPSATQNLVREELALIESHQGYAESPIFGYFEDYSQYVPRGHYTRNLLLECYFMSMMWLGRMTFTLLPDERPEATAEQTLMALIIVQALNASDVNGEPAMTVWTRIYDPTVFFVGKSDDLNIYQYTAISEQVYGEDFIDLTVDELADSSLLNAFITQASKLSGPLITSPLPGSTPKGFRFMGQRFIPDSYMFDRLTTPTVPGRLMPRGLDVMAVLGSPRAQEILDQVYDEDSNPNYTIWMNSMQVEFTSKPAGDWAQNLYWNWLYSLMPLLVIKNSGYPLFMQIPAWQDKELVTSLGSWAELRHDTILYAKQSSSWECIPPVPPTLKGYVEPNPHLYARLAALARFMITGFENRGLLLESFHQRLIDLENFLLSLKNVSEKELTNTAPSPDEYALMHKCGQILENIVTFPPEETSDLENETDEQMPVMADVHTDALNNLVLEVGVGYPFDIYVIVPVEDSLKVTRGAVFSYYEFSQPISDRLTDESWQEILKSDNPKKPPVWTGSFIDMLQSFLNPYPYPYDVQNLTDVCQEHKVAKPEKIGLKQCYPNPFNPETTICFHLTERAHVKLVICNILGQTIRTLFDEFKTAGTHTIIWDGKDGLGRRVASGIYLYKLEASNFVQVKKMIMSR